MRNGKKVIKEWLKTIPGKILNYHGVTEKSDILLFANRRSGSTWLLELISSQYNIKYSDQPPNLYLYRAMYENKKYNEIASQTEFKKYNMKRYVEGILDDERQVSTPWNLFSETFSMNTNRYIVKITDMLSFINELSEIENTSVVYLVRHPIPTSISTYKRGWQPVLEPFLRNGAKVLDEMDRQQTDYAKSIYKKGNRIEKYSLEWILRNLIPLKKLKKSEDWIIVTYEEMVLKPKCLIKILKKELELENEDRMHERIDTPSKNAFGHSRHRIEKKDRESKIREWKNECTTNEREKVHRLLSVFGIDEYYSAQDCLPSSTLMHTE